MKLSELDSTALDTVSDCANMLLPRLLPRNWRILERYTNASWYYSNDGLTVCVEVEMHDERDLWLHISVSRSEQTPNYTDLVLVKRLFVRTGHNVIQIFQPASELHPICLHLWSPITRDPLPDLLVPKSRMRRLVLTTRLHPCLPGQGQGGYLGGLTLTTRPCPRF